MWRNSKPEGKEHGENKSIGLFLSGTILPTRKQETPVCLVVKEEDGERETQLTVHMLITKAVSLTNKCIIKMP